MSNRLSVDVHLCCQPACHLHYIWIAIRAIKLFALAAECIWTRQLGNWVAFQAPRPIHFPALLKCAWKFEANFRIKEFACAGFVATCCRQRITEWLQQVRIGWLPPPPTPAPPPLFGWHNLSADCPLNKINGGWGKGSGECQGTKQ